MQEPSYMIRRAVYKDIPTLVDCRMGMLSELSMVAEHEIETVRQGTYEYMQEHIDDKSVSA